VLRCCGDEDRTTQSFRRRALSRALKAEADVLVELAELSFADTSFLMDLAAVSRRLRRRGGQVLLRGAQPNVAHLIAATGVDRLPGVTVLPSAPAAPATA
jgi:anti-anti-sigma factor